ncbi:MAG: hypothetical protein IKC74_06570 [Clostridia bacterium]|nr:hypothetical protein [Clostridia bacterium]
MNLKAMFPPSNGCTCSICQSYCKRPGWWTVDQAELAITLGYADRMMMEISPDFRYAVLSPAFYGCEGYIATNEASKNYCNFLKNGLCELHNTKILPLECAFCHHERTGQGKICHDAISMEWKTLRGQGLVAKWQDIVNLDEKLK